MRYKIFSLLILVFFVLTLFSQTELKKESYTLNWQSTQKWQLNSNIKNVISFQGALYPAENYLPYFNKRILIDISQNYEVQIANEVYVKLTLEELNLITPEMVFGENVEIKSEILRERTNSYLDVKILPFVKKQNNILKLKSFDLEFVKKQSIKKAQSASVHSFVTNSVLKQGKFVKIKIANSGIYKLTFDDLNSMGVAPANVRIFGYGGAVLEQSFLQSKIDDLPELSIYMEKGSDGVFNAGDYVLFYAQGIQKWVYDSSKSMFTHQINPYSNNGYYFVTSDAGVGKKIEVKAPVLSSNPDIFQVNEFVDYQVYEKEITSLGNSGKEFYGETFISSDIKNISFNFPNAINSNSTKVRLDVAGVSSTISTFDLSLDGSQKKSLSIPKRTENDHYEKAKAANGNFVFSPQSGTLNFNILYNKPTSTSVGYLNYLEINCRRALKMAGSEMAFQNVDNFGKDGNNQYILSDANANVQIWDISDLQNISQIETSLVSGALSFYGQSNQLKRYLAIDPTASSSFPKPETIGVVTNQNLHALTPVEFVILTHPNFLTQAEELAQAHREIDQMNVAVVTTEQVYNEFSSGTPDATAYRWLMKMFYDRALATGNTNDMPRYLLLFGKGSYDNRKIIPNSGENFILTYQAENSLVETLSYVTDDYFAFLDDNEGTQVPSHLLDIGVGRFTVTNTTQAKNVVDKTIEYMKNTKKGIWKNQLCFVADDGDGALHVKQADSIASTISRTYPSFQVNKIYLDAYLQEKSASGDSYPLARTQFQNMLRSGMLVLNYTGHAGTTGWTDEQVLTNNDVLNMSNKNLPLWIGATCDFLMFDRKTVSAGEQVVLNRSGGGIGILSAARPVYASQNFNINKLVGDNLFKKENGKHLRVGDIISRAKNNVGSEINKLSYVYLGDPALKLNYPTNYSVKTTNINQSTSFGNDTLRALSVVTIKGNIVDASGNINTSFNGELHGIVYDKAQKITTLNNHNDGAYSYIDRVNTLFSGKAEVKNGLFSFTFMLPKDIKYNYGAGRINYYAYDKTTSEEAQGYFENFIVGGTNVNVANDIEGPKLQLFLNSENFVSGDKVNQSPMFIAEIEDVSGINRVGSGIGHDLMLTIDQDAQKSYIINDYFEAVPNEYSKGVVRFKLPVLTEGKHTLTFRAWDLLNNSSVSTIDFEVVNDLLPQIFKVSNFPNPVKTDTRIIVEHDRPETILNTTIEIFDLAGRKIWAFKQTNADEIYWDLVGNDGVKVKSGIYLYRVSISTKDSDVYSKTNKMLIVE